MVKNCQKCQKILKNDIMFFFNYQIEKLSNLSKWSTKCQTCKTIVNIVEHFQNGKKLSTLSKLS